MEPHQALQTAHVGPTYEHGRRAAIVRRPSSLHLVVLELDHGWVHPERGQEPPHDVAHAARSAAEDDHWILRHQPLDPGLRGLHHVDG